MADHDKLQSRDNRETRWTEYQELRAEGVLPADIGASWRLERAGADLYREVTRRLGQERDLPLEAIQGRVPPQAVLNLACRIDELARNGLELGLRLAGVDEVAAPISIRSPFQCIAEVRRERVQSDPARGTAAEPLREVAIDAAPLCAKLIEQAGFLDGGAAAGKGVEVSVDLLFRTPLIEASEGSVVSIRDFARSQAREYPLNHSADMIESIYDVIPQPEARIMDGVQLGLLFALRGDDSLARALGRRIPGALRHDALSGEELDLRFITVETKGALVELSSIVLGARNLFDALGRAADRDILSSSEPFAGRTLAGREVAERAIAERVTHDVGVQRRVAEHILYERISPADYSELSPQARTEFKTQIEDTLQRRVELRRNHLSDIERLGSPGFLMPKAEQSLDQAVYELRCFRLSKAKL